VSVCADQRIRIHRFTPVHPIGSRLAESGVCLHTWGIERDPAASSPCRFCRTMNWSCGATTTQQTSGFVA